MKKIFLLFLFISSFLFAQDEIKRHPLWIDLGSGVATPKAQYNIYPFGNQLGNLGATANRWNFIYGDTTITNHLANTTWTFNSVAITTTGSQFNYLSGATGTTGTTTTNLVFSTSPVLVAPTLGVASATQILNGNGSATSPSYSFTSDTNTGIYRKGADTLGIVTNGTNVVTFAGINVGFGADNPNEKVDVNGNINIRSGYGLKVVNSGTNEIEFTGTASTTNIYSANDIYLLAASGKSLNLGAGGSNSKLVVASDGNVSIGATTSLHKTSIVSPTTANYFYGLNIVNANINKTRTTIAQSTDTANVNIKISTLGNPQFTMKGATGNTILLVDSSATSLSNALTLLDPGTSANSYAITLTADNATTPQYGSVQVMYGANPYIRISPPNAAGVATAFIDLKSNQMIFPDSTSLTANTGASDVMLFKAVDNDDGLLYEIARLSGGTTPTFDLLAGRLTGALNANSQDINNATSISLTDGTDTYKQIISSDKWTLQNDAGSPATVLDVDSTGLASGRYYDASDNTFGEYFIDDTDPDTTSVTATPKAIKDFSTDAARNQNFTATTDSTITILKAGKYRVDWGATIKTTAGGGTTVRGSIYVNDTRKTNTGGKRYLSGTNDTGNFGDPSILVLAVNDVIKLKYYSAGTPTVVTEHASIVINRVD